MECSRVSTLWDVTEEECEEFSELLLTLAQANSGAGHYLSILPSHLLPVDSPTATRPGAPCGEGRVPTIESLGSNPVIVLDWDVADEAGDNAETPSVTHNGSEVSGSQQAMKAQPTTAWVESASVVMERRTQHWAGHALWAIVHFFTTIITSVIVPLAVVLLVELSEGSKFSMFVLFISVAGAFVFASWRIFWVCSGVRSNIWTPIVYWLMAAVVTAVALWGPTSAAAIRTMGVRCVWLYVLSALFFDAANRPFKCRAWMVLGFFVAALPFYTAPVLHEWLDRKGKTTSAFGSSVNVLLASSLWSVVGWVVTTVGGIAWRKGSVRGRKTLKVFEFNTHMEVALTTGGLQLFSGDAMVLYVAWAVLVYAIHAIMLLPATRRMFSAGRTPALHIARRFVNLVAAAYGIFLGLFFVLVCTWIQMSLHPECYDTRSDSAARVALIAPTLSRDSLSLWIPCALFIIVCIAFVHILAVCSLKYTEVDLALPSRPGTEAAKEAQWVTNMAKQRPLTMLLTIARVCTKRSQVEVRAVITMQLLLMPYFWYALSGDVNSHWSKGASWFQC